MARSMEVSMLDLVPGCSSQRDSAMRPMEYIFYGRVVEITKAADLMHCWPDVSLAAWIYAARDRPPEQCRSLSRRKRDNGSTTRGWTSRGARRQARHDPWLPPGDRSTRGGADLSPDQDLDLGWGGGVEGTGRGGKGKQGGWGAGRGGEREGQGQGQGQYVRQGWWWWWLGRAQERGFGLERAKGEEGSAPGSQPWGPPFQRFHLVYSALSCLGLAWPSLVPFPRSRPVSVFGFGICPSLKKKTRRILCVCAVTGLDMLTEYFILYHVLRSFAGAVWWCWGDRLSLSIQSGGAGARASGGGARRCTERKRECLAG